MTLIGSGLDSAPIVLIVVGVLGLLAAIVLGWPALEPFLDVRLFRDRVFASAAIVSLLTGYAFATAIIGSAVFVDRVLYGGPADQQAALGSLAAATAIGALASGFIVRVLSLQIVTIFGLLLSGVALFVMSAWTPATSLGMVALAMATFGLGFGLTVTARSTAAVERAGEAAFGVASATVTVARMIGMSVGLAVLTAYGSTTIDRLHDQIYNTPGGYLQYIPVALQGRDLHDPLVVGALETWASGEAARIMVGLFLVAAALVLISILPGLALGSSLTGRRRGVVSDVPQQGLPDPS